MSVSGVAGAYAPRSWTPIQNSRSDDTAQTAASNPPDDSGTPTTPYFGKLTQEPSDSISVSLPNGMSIGMFHIGAGSSGFDAQMIKSLEDLVSNLSAYTTTSKGTVDGTQPDAVSNGSKNTASNGDLQGMQAIDMIHVDLPNGISIEVRHASSSDADGGLAAMNEMEKAMEELVDHFSSLGNGSTGSASTTASAAANQHRLAAYAEQAKQTSLAAGLGLSRES